VLIPLLDFHNTSYDTSIPLELLTPGYWHSMFYPANYWCENYWANYGLSTPSLSSSNTTRLREIIRNFEKQNPTKTVFTVGTCEPGLDNYECRLREIKYRMEQQNRTKTVFTVGTAEPGLDNYECVLREVKKKMENQ
jgi:hypothetical protein